MIYQLKISLNEIRPLIWRRIKVSGDVTLNRLHSILQKVMGWENYHLHQFLVDGQCYGIPDPDYEDDYHKTISDKSKKLSQIAGQVGSRFEYEYDFGDSWRHTIQVEKIETASKNNQTASPVCIDGKRACPPEDCGGVGGYQEFVKAYCDPEHEEHADMFRWRGPGYDPERFDIDQINKQLARYS